MYKFNIEPQLQTAFPFKAPPFFMNKITHIDDGLYGQICPDFREFRTDGLRDPLGEEQFSPVNGLVHRYPNRVLLITTHQCFGYCRFCTRKRNWGTASPFFSNFNKIIRYISSHKSIDEAIISGGDPLTLTDSKLAFILKAFKRISHIKTIRIATRALTFQPARITKSLLKILKTAFPIYMMTHFNHPAELDCAVSKKTKELVSHGIILMNQSVLLKGINDNKKTLEHLSSKMIASGIIPYALHQLDYTSSIQHFRVSAGQGRRLIEAMRKNFSGIGIPHYVLDRKHGKGKKFLII